MFDQAKLQLDIILLKSGFTTDNLNFHSLYNEEDIQVVRIFPWPRNIPSDWVLDRDHKLINAAVTAYSENGEVLFHNENIEGGDIVLLDNSKNPGRRIHSFTITNNSDSGYDLIFFTLKAERTGPEETVNPSSINTLSAAKAIEHFWNYRFDPKTAASSPSTIGQNPGNHTKKSH